MLLTALALISSFTQAPGPVELPAALAGADVRLVVQASWSHVSAENLGATPQLLLFSEPSVGFRSARKLAPGERVTFALPDSVAPTFRMEAFEGPTLRSASTGSFSLADLGAATGEAAFGVRHPHELQLVEVNGATLTRVATGTSLLPSATSGSATGAAHVPTPIPTEDRRPATRRIEKRPLPPV
ncbi:MAG: hypothetical protein R3F49_14735 [Planctomycetota bacterium]